VRKKHLKKIKNTAYGFEKVNQIRSSIPAVTHVDNSARIQTVNKYKNDFFYNLIESFYNITGVPILINTSFNVRGEPIVCSPQDAIKCFLGTHLDILVIENYILIKANQPKELLARYDESIAPD